MIIYFEKTLCSVIYSLFDTIVIVIVTYCYCFCNFLTKTQSLRKNYRSSS